MTKITFLRLGLCLPLLLSVACSTAMHTEPTPLSPLPPAAPTLELERRAVSDLGSEPANEYANYASDLFEALHEYGGRQISDDEGTELVLADVGIQSRFTETNWGWSLPLMLVSFGALPLGWVPLDMALTYTVDYAVDDRAGREVLRGELQGVAEGQYDGWYSVRGMHMIELMDEEAQFSAKDAARLVLNDLRRRTPDLVAAAEHQRANPTLAPAEIAAVDRVHRDRVARREARRAESKHLLAAKERLDQGGSGSAGMLGLASGSAAVAPSAQAAAVMPAARRPVALLLRPAAQGAALQEEVLFNTMQASLSKTHRVVTGPEVEAAASACQDAACRRAALRSLGADQLFHVRLLREGNDAQLVVGVQKGAETQSRSVFCEACTTGKLDASAAELTQELAAAMAPPVPAMGPVPASMPVAQPAGNSMGGAVGDAVKQCLAKQAAMQACSMVPSFGKIACRAAAQAKFSGVVCP